MTTLGPTEHPQPLLRRDVEILDGRWEFSLHQGDGAPSSFDREIEVPYAPESPASGIGVSTVERCWYRRDVRAEHPGAYGRVLVHFGAVDRVAEVFANGSLVARHTGGYVPFAADVTDHLRDGEVDITVRVTDDPADLDAPRGKQDWREQPHAIWYPRTTGVWRSVWTERVPATRIASLDLSGCARTMTVTMRASVEGPVRDGLRAGVRITDPRGRVLVDDAVPVADGEVERTFVIGDRGTDDRTGLVWWPRRPTLLDVEAVLVDASGNLVDRVESYTALRDVEVADGQVLLNGRPYPLRFVLDQGYWRDTGLTAPSTDELRRDIELTKALGFNGARKHQKVEDPRYLAWADRLGLLVWVEMPSAYRFTARAADALVHEWAGVVARAKGHPSVIGWVPLTESWGVPEVATSSRERALVRALAAIAAALGDGQPVSANDGWETLSGDVVGVHDYDQDPDVLRTRYGTRVAIDGLLTGRRWDGRLADLDRRDAGGRAVVLSEFGGIAVRVGETADDAWGYREVGTPDDLLANYRDLWAAVHESDALAGACWTQLTDTYQEINGLLTMDRTPKVDLEKMAAATRGRAR